MAPEEEPCPEFGPGDSSETLHAPPPPGAAGMPVGNQGQKGAHSLPQGSHLVPAGDDRENALSREGSKHPSRKQRL